MIESKLDPGRGPVVTILDPARHAARRRLARRRRALGQRARDARLHRRARQAGASPGEPVEILGFDGVPEAGEHVRVVENDRRARQLAGERAQPPEDRVARPPLGHARSRWRTSSSAPSEGQVKELNLVVKADVAGSLEALEDEIAKLPQ